MEPVKIPPSMSDDAVKARTGKTWTEWFAILDAAGAGKMTHPQIATYLSTEQAVPDWWSQMVTVTYEKARGLRESAPTPRWIPDQQRENNSSICIARVQRLERRR